MYRKIALKLTRLFIEKKVIQEEKQDIYAYGFEIILSSLVYLFFFIIFALISNTLFPSLLFWLGLFVTRKIAGGHHAKSYIACHILFAINHVLCILLLKVTPENITNKIIIYLFLFSICSIFLFAPVDHPNKPFIKNEYNRYKLLSRIYCLILFLIMILFLISVIPYNQLLYGYTIGTFSATISLLGGKINKFERTRKWKKWSKNFMRSFPRVLYLSELLPWILHVLCFIISLKFPNRLTIIASNSKAHKPASAGLRGFLLFHFTLYHSDFTASYTCHFTICKIAN